MDKRQAVDQHRHVIAVVVASLLRVLVHHLHTIVVHIALVDKGDVANRAVIHAERIDMVALNAARLLDDAVVVRGNPALEQACPFLVGEADVIQSLQLRAKIGDELLFAGNNKTLIALAAELFYKSILELRFRLIGGRTALLLGERRAHRSLTAKCHDVEVDAPRKFISQRGVRLWLSHARVFVIYLAHATFSLKLKSLSR